MFGALYKNPSPVFIPVNNKISKSLQSSQAINFFYTYEKIVCFQFWITASVYQKFNCLKNISLFDYMYTRFVIHEMNCICKSVWEKMLSTCSEIFTKTLQTPIQLCVFYKALHYILTRFVVLMWLKCVGFFFLCFSAFLYVSEACRV